MRAALLFDVPSPSESSSLSIITFADFFGDGDRDPAGLAGPELPGAGLCGGELCGAGLCGAGLAGAGLAGASSLYRSSASPVGDIGALMSERGETPASGEEAPDETDDAPRDSSDMAISKFELWNSTLS